MRSVSPPLPAAAIFDVDGVLVDSNPFHLRKWKALLNRYDVQFDPGELPNIVLGFRDDRTLRHFFGQQLSDEAVQRLTEELEEKFRTDFAPHAQPMPGVVALLRELSQANIPMAVASAGPGKNVEFLLDALQLRHHFRCVMDGDAVTRAKPDPEIYLAACAHLRVEPAHCVGFEDSFAGVAAVKQAGMKCVAVASTFTLEELRQRTQADLVVPTLENLSLERLRCLFADATHSSGKAK